MSNTYCQEADINALFGSTNVLKWSDLDNDGSADTGRINAAIAAAGDEIDSWLRPTQYTIPLADEDGNTPTIIETLAAEYAGVWLYTHRGVERDHELQPVAEKVQATLQQIRNGDRQIDAM